MRNLKIDFNKAFKKIILIYGIIFLAGIIATVAFGVKLDLNFSGGTKISYSYKGTLEEKDVRPVISKQIKGDFTFSQSTALAGDTSIFEIVFAGKDVVSASEQTQLINILKENFKDNNIEEYNSNTVSSTLAETFFLKSMVAVIITAIFVVIYIGIRFRKIGGVSAALTAFVALILDVLITFFACVFFRLQIDSNYIAVVLTILGYSLNDTIVIYDRVRENRGLEPTAEIGELVNKSICQTAKRNILTSITTLLAIMTVMVVAELFGLTTLRTFSIPLAFGVISGGITSLAISGPLWVVWKRAKQKKFKA